MNRRAFLKTVGSGALALFGATAVGRTALAQAPSGKQPNILLVISDDQGFGDLHSHGNDLIETPVQDSIAEQGARFDRFYVCPVCAPTRAGLLTGRYHPRMGVSGTSRGWERMRTEEITLAEILKEGGYATGAFGKWHNGHYYPEHPNAQGFDEFVGFCMGHWNGYFDPLLERNGVSFRDKGYIVDVLTDHAMDYIEKHKEGPFFCYVAHCVPHSPYLVPDSYFDKYKARGLDDLTASVYGMTECMDDNLGRLLAKLDELDLVDDTIVIFMSDNGPARIADYPRYNAGMRGGKGSVHEGGVRVPFFIRWPGRIKPGGVVKPIASYVDVLPTLLELVGVPKQDKVALDGLSLAPLLNGDEKNWPDRKIYSLQSQGPNLPVKEGAVRTQRWLAVTKPQNKDPNWELFDMLADPSEKQNLAGKNPEVLADLKASFEEWFKDVTRDGLDVAPVPIGYPERPQVDVFAQDAQYMGGLGNTTGNNGYIVEWRDTESYPQWTLDVVTPGLYEISLMYTCAKKNIGSKMQVTIGNQQVQGVVDKAYDPDFMPSPQRVIFKHYYEKPFTPMKIGVLKLKKGATKMTVKALSIPGDTAIDLKAVRIKRLG